MSKRYALLIANNKFKNYESLNAPVNDVYSLAEILRNEDFGYFDDVVIIEDKNKAELDLAIFEFYQKCDYGDLALFYYSGHGVLDKLDNLYIATYETSDEKIPPTSLATSIICSYMNDFSRAASKIVILDCCYSGSITKDFVAKSGTKINIAHSFESKGTYILTASGDFKRAYEDKMSGISIFTNLLVEGIKTGDADFGQDGMISLDDIYRYICKNIKNQKPQKHSYIQQGQLYISKNPFAMQKITYLNNQNLKSKFKGYRELLFSQSRKNYKTDKKLSIIDVILPGVIEKDRENIVINRFDKSDYDCNLFKYVLSDIQLRDCWHTVLLGEGGMGKTTTLLNLWESYGENNICDPIPIFIPLNEINSSNYTDRRFIVKYILRKYMSKLEPSSDDINNLWEFLKEPLKKYEDKVPAFMLLLDGFNEVTRKDGKFENFIIELKIIAKELKGVQLIITSRYDITNTLSWTNDFTKLELLELKKWQIEKHLKDKNKVLIGTDSRLLNVLKNPLMLTLYSVSSNIMEEYKGHKYLNWKENVETTGEMIWNYIESQIVKKIDDGKDEIYLYKFILNHLISEIGWVMYKKNVYIISEEEIEDALDRICLKLSKIEFHKTFKHYISCAMTLSIDESNFIEKKKRFEKVVDLLLSELKIFRQRDNEIFEFVHQHFRDYFAALHVLNEISTGLQYKKIPSILKNYTINYYILKFMGEIEGEHYNSSKRTEEPNNSIFERLIDVIRIKESEEDVGYSLWNVIETLKLVREDLVGCDLTKLDFKGISINGVKCSNSSIGRYAKFNNSKIEEVNLLSQGHSNSITSVAITKDCKYIISGSEDRCLKVWDIKTSECKSTLEGHLNPVLCAAVTKDGKKIISGSSDNTIKVWSMNTGECLKTIKGHIDSVECLVLTPDNKFIITGSGDKSIRVWDINTGKCLKKFDGHLRCVYAVEISPDMKTIISGSDDATIKLWDIEKGECINTFYGHSNTVYSIKITPDGEKFISAASDNSIIVWNINSGEVIKTLTGHSDFVYSISITPDGKNTVSASDDGTIKIWDIEKGTCTMTLQAHSDYVDSVEVSSDGEKIVSGSEDRNIKVWDFNTGECLKTIKGISNYIDSLVITPDGTTIISGLSDNTIKLWDIEKCICYSTLEGHQGSVSSVSITPDQSKIVSGSWDNSVKIWDFFSGDCIHTLKGHSNYVDSIAITPDGKKIVSGSDDCSIKVWDIETGMCLLTFDDLTSSVSSIAISNDGKYVFAGLNDSTIFTCDIYEDDYISAYVGHTGYISCIKVSWDDTFLISGSNDNTIKLWDRKSKICFYTLTDHLASVYSIEITKDNSKIISGSLDKTVRIWDVETGKCIKILEGHRNRVDSVTITPDDKYIVSGSLDRTIKIWDIESGECLKTLENVYGLYIYGCSMENLYNDNQNDKDDLLKVLKMYGAIV